MQSPTNYTPTPSAQFPVVALGSKEFMTALKDKLSNANDNPINYVNSQVMLEALKSGSLKITDPTTGESIVGWDPSSKGATPSTVKTTEKDEWSDFLNDHLKRGDNGALIKSKDGTYIDAKTGDFAAFGKINGKYYYLTWPGNGPGTTRPAATP